MVWLQVGGDWAAGGDIGKFAELTRGSPHMGLQSRAGPSSSLHRKLVTPVSSELDGIKGYVSSQREEVEAQIHLGPSPQTELKPLHSLETVSPSHQDLSLPSPSLTLESY